MKRFQTKGIILRRTDYGETDRIIVFLTPDHGKVSAMAKGVRKPKSKLAGGIELFSVSSITFMQGKSNLHQLISTRLDTHFGAILKDYDFVEFGYKAITLVNRITEDEAEGVYFDMLHDLFKELDAQRLPLATIECWFLLQLMREYGYLPNLTHNREGKELVEDVQYDFDVSSGIFVASNHGQFIANDIKAWRILAQAEPDMLLKISGITASAEKSLHAIQSFVQHHVTEL